MTADRRGSKRRADRLLFATVGAWGVGIYDNDDAADWAGELPERGLDAVRAQVVHAHWRLPMWSPV
jgi:hypothetical protein